MPVLVPSRLPAGSRLRPVALTVGLSVGAVGALGALGSEPAVAAPKPAADPVLTALEAELERTHGVLRLEDYERPYFVSFRVVDRDQVEVTGRFGALVEDDRDTKRQVAVDVRVGDYSFDSSPDPSDFSFEDGITFEPPAQAPLDADVAALRGTVWLLADAAYKKALSSHLRKRAKKVSDVAEKHVDSFSRESPATHRDSAVRFDVDRKAWAERVRRLSARFRRDPAVLEGAVRISATHTKTWLVSSEGSRIVKEDVLYSVGISALARAPDGMLLDQGQTLYGRTLAELPDERGLSALVDEAVLHLSALSRAPVADPYTGPAILEPEATGVFFHETIGHRLEGERQKDENEGRTFKGQIGQPILPAFLSLRDDPTQRTAAGLSLNGFYPFDDEGVPSQNTILVQGGVLKTFLTGRTPVEDAPKSNGHGRAQGTQRPVARMGNLIIEAAGAVPRATLKQMLLDETRKAGKPFGLIIRDITGGSTNTSNYGYQAFKGSPRMVYRVDAQTGAETLVRGVEMVGTPLTAVNKIVAASQEVGVFNGFCGAESGYVPVSTVAPATLFREIELQRSQRQKERTPLLPAPWAPPAQGKHP
jgi:TldD protein